MINITNFLSAKPLTAAQQQLVVSNLHFSEKLARTYAKSAESQNVDIAELISEANMGLTIAATRYNPAKGASFVTFAYWWCIKAIQSRLNDGAGADFVSIDDALENDAEELLGLTTEDDEIQSERAELARNLLKVLNPQELKVINLLFGFESGKEMSVAEVAKAMGLKPARIRQIRDQALGSMRIAAMNGSNEQ